VNEEIAFFEQLREPDAGPLMSGSLYGNVNFPPPQVLFQFGVSYIPLVWDISSITITADHFYSGIVRGIVGIPKKCEIDIALILDEGHPLNIANQIAKKAEMYAASAESILRETMVKIAGTRKELPGIFGINLPNSKIRKSGVHKDRLGSPHWTSTEY
jgi:hypothetical protein